MRPKPELLFSTKQSEDQSSSFTLQCLGSVEGMVAGTLQYFEECGGYGVRHIAVF